MFYICSMSDLHVIWFRHDLRVHDNAALSAACASGGLVLPLYIFDADHWHRPDTSKRQFDFLMESLADLDSALRKRGSQLCLKVGPATQILSQIHSKHGIASLHFHASGHEAQRDQQVRNWAMKAGIPLREQGGNRSLSASPTIAHDSWQQSMRQPRLAAPDSINSPRISSEDWPMASDFDLNDDTCTERQIGGRTNGVLQLRQFLTGRGRCSGKRNLCITDREDSASGLSPHLVLGTISDREVWQATMRARAALESDGDNTFTDSLDTFAENLRQRSRLLAATPRHGHMANAGLSADTFARDAAGMSDPRLTAWSTGRTGFPLLDASMRCLQTTGRLEAELRSLLLSFATCHLWLDPVAPSQHLARLSTDFDTALFYGNARKVIGISSRPTGQIPNPVRQSLVRDPKGTFIRKWVPEIANLTNEWIHSPWEAPKSLLADTGIVLGQTYPMRMVDHIAAARAARNHLFPNITSKALPFDVPAQTRLSRKPGIPKRTHPRALPSGPTQLSFDLQGHG